MGKCFCVEGEEELRQKGVKCLLCKRLARIKEGQKTNVMGESMITKSQASQLTELLHLPESSIEDMAVIDEVGLFFVA